MIQKRTFEVFFQKQIMGNMYPVKQLLLVLFFFTLVISPVSANIQKTLIQGELKGTVFKGTISFQISNTDSQTILFHLPPNRYQATDLRESYLLQGKSGQVETVSRSKLKLSRKYLTHPLHYTQKITIKHVQINQNPVNFKIRDNPDLTPTLCHIDGLLTIFIPPEFRHKKVNLEIMFETQLPDLSDSYLKIMWDYAPRPVVSYKEQPDLADHAPAMQFIETNIQIAADDSYPTTQHFHQTKRQTHPVALITPWQESNRVFQFSANPHLEDRLKFYKRRLNQVFAFLVNSHWIQLPDKPFDIIIWNGAFKVSGHTILLPEQLFRYHFMFSKTFEIYMLEAVVASVLKHNFNLNSYQYPWIIPSIQAEVVRAFIDNVYQGNPSLFPWDGWMSPNYYLDNTVKKYLLYQGNAEPVDADLSGDLTHYTAYYHPWYEKGFHLLKVMDSGKPDYDQQIKKRIKGLLHYPEETRPVLDSELFFTLLKFDSASQLHAKNWLLSNGHIDYSMGTIEISEKNQKTIVDIELKNNGNISPPVEIEVAFGDHQKKREKIPRDSGNYQIVLPDRPKQIQIDPDHHLLEETLLNNSWNIPVKLRPFWDIPQADQWLFTISPEIAGNVFDGNILGLDFELNYIDQTYLEWIVWRGGDNELLTQLTFSHIGFPTKNSELTLVNTQIQASEARIVSIKQYLDQLESDFWLNLTLTDEELDTINTDSLAVPENKWQGIAFSAMIPLYQGVFTDWITSFYSNYSINRVLSEVDYQRYGFTSLWKTTYDHWAFYLDISEYKSDGTVPPQKEYAMGGSSAIPGFPRTTDLLFEQRNIAKLGSTLPAFLMDSRLNFLQFLWLNSVRPSVNLHFGMGRDNDSDKWQEFKDIEFDFSITGEFINMYVGEFNLGIAYPLDHQVYKDPRIILLTDWVF